MAWNFIGLGGAGSAFQLFKKTTDGLDAIFADAAARDSYFAANPADLTLVDDDEFKIIKLLDNGAGQVAYQQRQLNTWVDVTSLVQGEQGPAGATGNSYFFSSIAARDAFFNTPPNEGLLEANLPICVNVGSETVSNFTWNGPTAPVSYDDTLWVIASIQVSSGTVFLGQAGASISSGNEVLDFKTADGTKRYLIGVEYSNIGSSGPIYWELGLLSDTSLATLFTQTLSDPQSVQYQFFDDFMLVNFQLRPATTGELRIQMFLGTDATGPQLLDSFFQVTAPDIGSIITYTLPNDNLMEALTDVFIIFSGVDLFGDLQTGGPFTGLTVPFITLGLQAGNQVNFVSSSAISGLAAGEVIFGDDNNSLESETNFFWDSTDKNLGVNEPTPDTTLHVNSGAANTESIVKIENTAGFIEEYVTSADPNGVISAGFAAKASNITTGELWIKESASGNTGWVILQSSTSGGDVDGPSSSVDNELTIYDGTTGKLIKAGSQILAPPGNRGDLQLRSTGVTEFPNIGFYDNLGAEKAAITYEVNDAELIMFSDDTLTITSTSTLNIENTNGVIDMDSPLGVSIFQSTGDTIFALEISTSGANGAKTEQFTGNRDPEGIISGAPGSVYFRSDGVNSNIYQLHSTAVANTPWIEIAQGTGAVIGPGSAVDNELALFDSTTGKLIKGGSNILATPGDFGQLNLQAVAVTDRPVINWEDNLGSITSFIEYQPDNQIFEINSSGFVIQINSDDLDINSTGIVTFNSPATIRATQTTGDTVSVIEYVTTGANGGTAGQFTGNRDPDGLITATPGSMYFRTDGVNSNIYQLHSTVTANTPWIAVAQGTGAGDVNGPGSSVNNELAVYSGTTGKIIKAGTEILAVPGNAALLQMRTTQATSFPTIGFFDNLSAQKARIEYEVDDFSLNIAVDDDLHLTGGLDVFLETIGGSIDIDSSSSFVRMQGESLVLIANTTNLTLDATLGAISLTSTTASSFICTANLTLRSAGGNASLIGDTVDIDATTDITIDAAGGLISLDCSGVGNFTSAGNLTLQSTGGTALLDGDIVNVNADNGAINLTADTDINLDTIGGAISLDCNGVGNFTSALSLSLESTAATILVKGNTASIESDVTNIGFISQTTFDFSSNTVTNSFPVMSLTTSGGSGGILETHVGSQNPVNNVIGTDTHIYYRVNSQSGTDVFVCESSANSVGDWISLKGGPSWYSWGNNTINSSTTTRYLTPGYEANQATTSPIQIRTTRQGTFRDLYIKHNNPDGNGNDIVYTLRVNGSTTSLVVTLSSTGTQAQDTSSSVKVGTGDNIDIEITKASGVSNAPDDVMATVSFY